MQDGNSTTLLSPTDPATGLTSTFWWTNIPHILLTGRDSEQVCFNQTYRLNGGHEMRKIASFLLFAVLMAACQVATQEVIPATLTLSPTVVPPSETPPPPTITPTKAPTPTPIKRSGVIAFSEGYYNQADGLTVVNITTPGSQPLLQDLVVPIWNLAWSPTGDQIAFTSGIAGFDLNLINTDGSGLTTITHDDISSYLVPSWSPDGSTITVVKSNFFDTFEIQSIKTDGTGVTSSIQIPITFQFKVAYAWSPDGSRLVFTGSNQDGTSFGLYTVNLDGTGLVNLITTAGKINSADWSPDGKTIVYQTQGDVYTLNADGSQPQQLTANQGDNRTPIWSPGGTTIAFYSNRDRDGYHLYFMNPDGSEQRRILDFISEGAYINDLHWSPDEAYITIREGSKLSVVDLATLEIVRQIENAFLVAWKP
jgi:Tol biopolymer transport system component